MRSIKLGISIAFAAASLSASATDPLLTVHALTAGKYATVNVTVFGTNRSLIAGPQLVSLDGGEKFDAYCVDLQHWNTLPTTFPVQTLSTELLTHGQRIAYLYNTYAGSVTNSTQGAALQLAIWDVLTDGGDGFATGDFRSSVSGGVLTQANSFLTGSIGQVSQATWLKASNHGNGTQYQNLVGPPVPGPAAALPFAAWALALRRRRRQAQ